MWMNEGEIEQMLEFTKYEAPEFAPQPVICPTGWTW
jgi:hypothetical protein